jgi:hypothetical protein
MCRILVCRLERWECNPCCVQAVFKLCSTSVAARHDSCCALFTVCCTVAGLLAACPTQSPPVSGYLEVRCVLDCLLCLLVASFCLVGVVVSRHLRDSVHQWSSIGPGFSQARLACFVSFGHFRRMRPQLEACPLVCLTWLLSLIPGS